MFLRFFILLLLVTACSSPRMYREGELGIGDRPYHISIVVDAGHGGEDFGTHSLGKPRYHEKFVALSTSLMLKKYLEKMGYTVVMTRSGDIFIPLIERAKIANARAPSLFISMHYNAAANRGASGMEVFYYGDKSHRARESKLLAQNVLNEMLAVTGAKNRGVKPANFSVVRNTEVPAILVEGGFMTHKAEMRKIKEPRYQNKIAWGIAQGIDRYLLAR